MHHNWVLFHSWKEQEYLKEVEKSQYKQLCEEQHEKHKLAAEADKKVKFEIFLVLEQKY